MGGRVHSLSVGGWQDECAMEGKRRKSGETSVKGKVRNQGRGSVGQ